MIKFILSFSGQDGHACIVPANKSYFHLEQHATLSENAVFTVSGNVTKFTKGYALAVNPIKFNPAWTVNSKPITDMLIREYTRHTGKQARAGAKSAIAQILAASVATSTYQRPIRYSRDTHHKANKVLGVVVELFAKLGLINSVMGKDNQYQEAQSWFMATSELKLEIARQNIKLAFSEDESFLVLRSKANKNGIKKNIKIIPNSKNRLQLYELSEAIKAYNFMWLKHDLMLNDEHIIPFNYRIFNESKQFIFGGRAYRGEYLQLKERELGQRSQLTIDGYKTTEPDFSANHPYLLYAMVGIQLPTNPDYDVYELSGYDFDRDTVAKPATLKLINSTDEDTFIRGIDKSADAGFMEGYYKHKKLCNWFPFKKLSKDEQEARTAFSKRYKGVIEGIPAGTDGAELLAAIKEKHAPIAHLFCSDRIGLRLQNLDSNIIMAASHTLSAQDLPHITIHDSIRCRVQDEAVTVQAMIDAYFRITGGFYPKIK